MAMALACVVGASVVCGRADAGTIRLSLDERAPVLGDDPTSSAVDAAPALTFAGMVLYWENDARGFTAFLHDDDRHRTNATGIEVGLRMSPKAYDNNLRWLDFLGTWENPTVAVGAQFRHFIFTPELLSEELLVTDDRPYAGWLTLGLFMQRSENNTFDHLQVDVGVVGPYALAEEAQMFVHSMMPNTIKPLGWDNQLSNELAVNLHYQRRWRYRTTDNPHGLAGDVIPFAGFRVGNVRTDAIGGAAFRLGYNLPFDFGPGTIEDFTDHTAGEREPLSAYVYARLEGRAVARDIFLDGNTFANSHSIDKKSLVGTAQLGVEGSYEGLFLGWSLIFRTEEFDGQSGGNVTGQFVAGYRASF